MHNLSPPVRPGADEPVFVFGCPRSGTSLLSRIINAHPRIAIPFESHIYHYMYRWGGRYGDLHDLYRAKSLIADLLTLEDIKEWHPQVTLDGVMRTLRRYDFHGVFEAFMASWAETQGKPRWGEKTPQHTLQWREIVGAFPLSRVVYLVRDGRDVGLSYKQAFFGPKNMYTIAHRWVHYLRVGEEMRDMLGTERFHLVHYEDLISDPEATVRRICEFLKEEFHPAMLKPHQSDTLYRTDQRNLENLQRPILPGNSNRWETGMLERDLRVFEGVAGRDLECYGYKCALGPLHLSGIEKFFYRYVEHPPLKLIAMLNNRKTQRIMMQMLRIYLRRRWSLWHST